MVVKPGYKQTEVGVIPEDWEIKPLQDGISLLSGNHVLAKDCNTDGIGVPYITGPADFPNGIIQHSKFTEKPTKICHVNDILVTVKGSGAGTIVQADAAYCISRQLMAIRVSRWESSFIYSSLVRDSTIIGAAATGLIPGLSRGEILNKILLIPPLSEQRAIATALSDADARISSLDKIIAKKRDLKQAAMQELLTSKKRLLGFTGDWETMTLGDLFSFKNGLNKGKEFFGKGTPIVNYTDVYKTSGFHSKDIRGKVTLTYDELRTYEVRKGDVFFTRTSETIEDVGVASVILDEPQNMAFSGFLLRARPKNEILVDEFKKYCFSTREIRNEIVSKATYTTRALTNGRILSAVSITIPSPYEQRAIATVLSDMDAEIAALEQQRDKTRAIKEGMMQELLTGRIRLT